MCHRQGAQLSRQSAWSCKGCLWDLGQQLCGHMLAEKQDLEQGMQYRGGDGLLGLQRWRLWPLSLDPESHLRPGQGAVTLLLPEDLHQIISAKTSSQAAWWRPICGS